MAKSGGGKTAKTRKQQIRQRRLSRRVQSQNAKALGGTSTPSETPF